MTAEHTMQQNITRLMEIMLDQSRRIERLQEIEENTYADTESLRMELDLALRDKAQLNSRLLVLEQKADLLQQHLDQARDACREYSREIILLEGELKQTKCSDPAVD